MASNHKHCLTYDVGRKSLWDNNDEERCWDLHTDEKKYHSSSPLDCTLYGNRDNNSDPEVVLEDR